MESLPINAPTPLISKSSVTDNVILTEIVISRSINGTVLHDHNYASHPQITSSANFDFGNKSSSSGDATSGLMTASQLQSEVDRLNSKVSRQVGQLDKYREEIAAKTRELNESVKKLEEVERLKASLELEVKEKTELQDKFYRFRGSVTKASCSLLVLIKEVKREFNSKCGYCCCGLETHGIGVKEEDKAKLCKDLHQILELVQDSLRAWVVVDQVIDQEEVEKTEENLFGSKRKKALEGKENLVQSSDSDLLPEEDEVNGEIVEEIKTAVPLKDEAFNLNSSQSTGQDGTGKFLCQICQLRFHHFTDWKSHLKGVHRNRYNKKHRMSIECKDCGVILDNPGHIKKHRQTCRPNSEVIIKKDIERDISLEESSSLPCTFVCIKTEPESKSEPTSPIRPIRDKSPSCSPPILEMMSSIALPCPTSSVVSETSNWSLPVLERMEDTPMAELKQECNQVHATDIFKRHLGVYCICGERFDSQRRLNWHIHCDEDDLDQNKPEITATKGHLKGKDTSPLAARKNPLKRSAASSAPSTSTTIAGKNKGKHFRVKESVLDKHKPKVPPSKDKLKGKDDNLLQVSRKIPSKRSDLSSDPSTSTSTTVFNNLGARIHLEESDLDRNKPKVSTSKGTLKCNDASLPVSLKIPSRRKSTITADKESDGHIHSDSEMSDQNKNKSKPKVSTSKDPLKRKDGSIRVSLKIPSRPAASSCLFRNITTEDESCEYDGHVHLEKNDLNKDKPKESTSKNSLKSLDGRLRASLKIHSTRSTASNTPSPSTTTTDENCNGHVHLEKRDLNKDKLKKSSSKVPLKCNDASLLVSLKIPLTRFDVSSSPSTSIATSVTTDEEQKISKKMRKEKRRLSDHKADRKFSCEICSCYYRKVRYLSHHYESFHKIKDTSELIRVDGKLGKMFNCMVLVQKIDISTNDTLKSSKKTEPITTENEDGSMPGSSIQQPWRPIFKKKLKKLKFIKRKERFVCHLCQRHFPFYHKLVQHLAIKLHSVADDKTINSVLKYECKPCEKLFSDRVELLRHRVAFHRCHVSISKLTKLMRAKKRAENEGLNSDSISGPITRRSVKSISTAPTKSPRKQQYGNIKRSPGYKKNVCQCTGSNCENFKAVYITCTSCGLLVICPRILQQHLFDEHGVVDSLPKFCDTCGIIFKSKMCLLKHIKVAHTKPKLLAKKSFKKKRTNCQKGKKTEKRATSPKENFTKNKDLHRQVSAQGNGKACFKCSCGNTYVKKLYLFQHIQEASREKGKSFKCSSCPKIFPGNVHLKVHMARVHNYRKQIKR